MGKYICGGKKRNSPGEERGVLLPPRLSDKPGTAWPGSLCLTAAEPMETCGEPAAANGKGPNAEVRLAAAAKLHSKLKKKEKSYLCVFGCRGHFRLEVSFKVLPFWTRLVLDSRIRSRC